MLSVAVEPHGEIRVASESYVAAFPDVFDTC